MPIRANNHFSHLSIALLGLAGVLAACSPSSVPVGGRCAADSECAKGLLCTSGACQTKCSVITDCQQGQDCRLAAKGDSAASCTSVSYSNPSTGGFGADCSLFACNQGSSPCAEGFQCYKGASCDPYAFCTTGCSTDRDCPSQFFCSGTFSGSTSSGVSCTKNSDCAEDSFCSAERDQNGNPGHFCEKKTCMPRARCSDCATDEQCRQGLLQKDFVCAHDNAGGRFCGKPCGVDSDCLKPLKVQLPNGSEVAYGRFETCQADPSSGLGVCTPISGACHGKSAISSVTESGGVCSPCRAGVDGDCAEDTQCFVDPLGIGETFCSKSCTVRADKQANGSYAPASGTDTCPSGSYCYSRIPTGCGTSCTATGICTADPNYLALTCGPSPSSN